MNKKPLGIKNYGHICHLPGSRMGPADHKCHEGQDRICTVKTRDKHDRIIVQEKLDGSKDGKQIDLCPQMKIMTRKTIGSALVISGVVFGFAETAYFGWNFYPLTLAEYLCDGLAFIVAIAGIVIASEKQTKGEQNHG